MKLEAKKSLTALHKEITEGGGHPGYIAIYGEYGIEFIAKDDEEGKKRLLKILKLTNENAIRDMNNLFYSDNSNFDKQNTAENLVKNNQSLLQPSFPIETKPNEWWNNK